MTGSSKGSSAALDAFLPHPVHFLTHAEEPRAWRLRAPAQNETGPSAGFCLPRLGPGWQSAWLLRARFWGTVPRAKERGRIAPKHQAEASSVLPCRPAFPHLFNPFQFHGLLLQLFPPLQGGHSSRTFCFVGGCGEIVLCFVISLGVIVSPVFSCRLYGRVVGGNGEGEGPRALIVCFGRKKRKRTKIYISL